MKKIALMQAFLVSGAMLLLSSSSVGQGAKKDATPGWVKRYRSGERVQWKEWQNSLAPKGEAVSLSLTKNSKSDYVIVIPKNATVPEKRAASELQVWLEKITEAKLPIVTDDTSARAKELSVGNTSRLTNAARGKIAQAGETGYAIVVEGEKLFLSGAGEAGAMFATFALLEEDLGVRWYYEPMIPLVSWSVCYKELMQQLNAPTWSTTDGVYKFPQESSLTARIVPRAVKPSFPIRRLSPRRSTTPWGLRNRLNTGWAPQYALAEFASGKWMVHTFFKMLPPKKYFNQHPEYYSLIKGKRQWKHAQLCLSNPEVAKRGAEVLISDLRRASKHCKLASISAEDWQGFCECAPCRELEKRFGTRGGLILDFVNRIAREVAKEVPDATLTTLIYWDTNHPPTADIKAERNVALRYCFDWGASFTWPYHSMYDDKLTARKPDNRWVTWSQRENFLRWKKISPRMHAWMYPSQYAHTHAPMPNIRALAENLKFLAEQHVENAFIQPGRSDSAREVMRTWVLSKLLWNANLNVDELMADFIYGFYGKAAPLIMAYNELLWDNSVRYSDFSRERGWRHRIDDEMFQHGFVGKARKLLDEALAATQDEAIRQHIEMLKLAVVYVESALLIEQMDGAETPPDQQHYNAVGEELKTMMTRITPLLKERGATQLCYRRKKHSPVIWRMEDYLAEMQKIRTRRFEGKFLSADRIGKWKFRWDSADQGVAKKWFGVNTRIGKEWKTVTVPAFLSETSAGNATGHGWYRVYFKLSPEEARAGVELEFDGVDEEAWLYVNGKEVGEHTQDSEFIVGQPMSLDILWNRPFVRPVKPEVLRAGMNLLVVRIHNSAFDSGIHAPVRIRGR